MSGFWILVVFLLLIFLGMPIAYSMLTTGFLYILTTGSVSMSFIAQATVSGSASYTVLAIPFFMLAGELMNRSGITKKMFRFAETLVGHIPGGLGHVNVLASVLFAGMTGSAAADASGLGNIEIKAMKEAGYDTDFSVGITAASSTIGPIIPPQQPNGPVRRNRQRFDRRPVYGRLHGRPAHGPVHDDHGVPDREKA